MFYIKTLNQFIITLILLTILICIFFIPTNSVNNQNITIIDFIEDGNLLWPAPGYYKINSYYGKRKAPTGGASTYHKGIDIGIPQGEPLVAVTDGEITFTDFLGGGGYTITLTDSLGIKYSYCHTDPTYIVEKGQKVKKGQIIGYVGPKYVYSVPCNQYKDKNGLPTNGATTGPHLHFGIRVNSNYVNPLDYLPYN